MRGIKLDSKDGYQIDTYSKENGLRVQNVITILTSLGGWGYTTI